MLYVDTPTVTTHRRVIRNILNVKQMRFENPQFFLSVGSLKFICVAGYRPTCHILQNNMTTVNIGIFIFILTSVSLHIVCVGGHCT